MRGDISFFVIYILTLYSFIFSLLRLFDLFSPTLFSLFKNVYTYVYVPQRWKLGGIVILYHFDIYGCPSGCIISTRKFSPWNTSAFEKKWIWKFTGTPGKFWWISNSAYSRTMGRCDHENHRICSRYIYDFQTEIANRPILVKKHHFIA